MSKKTNLKILVVLANIIIAIVVFFCCFSYTGRQTRIAHQKAEESFISTATSMQKVAHGLLSDLQHSCNEWASYITAENCDMEKAIEILSFANIADYSVSHILDYNNLEGFADIKKQGTFFNESLSMFKEEFEPVLKNLGRYNTSKMHITQSFINPYTGNNVIGFCQDVTLVEDGAPKHFILMRTYTMPYITSQLFFPDYEKAKLSLITADGSFVIRSSTIDTDNFWEYVSVHNQMSEHQEKEMVDKIDSENIQVLHFLDKNGEDSLFVCIPAADDDWQFIAYVQTDDLNLAKTNFTIVFIVLIGLILIVGFDGAIMLQTNKRLTQSIEETRRANLAKTSFLSSMSHDIRTPMNAIVGMSTIAMRCVDDRARVEDCLKKITLASNHLLTLINDVLDISKIESGKLALNPVVFSLAESAENLVNIVRLQIREKGLEFNIHTGKIIKEYLFADEVRLNQIFINLLTNAVKYTDDGGKITLDLTEDAIPGDDDNVLLTYSVSDTGIGMSAEFQKNMYDTFSRAVDTRVNKITGTGLGLAITKQMVDLMGGTIECKSELGKGTTFTVKIKVPVTENITDELVLPPMHILIVDDDPPFLDTAVDTFKSLGIRADIARNGRTAIDMAMKRHESGKDYPIIITDWKMPGMDGLELTRQIREQIGDIPIILVSSYDWTEIEDDAKKVGVTAFINKPFFRSTVYYKLADLLHLETEVDPADSDNFSDLKGMKILIAEDNELNWEITNELLTYYGVVTTHAQNGRECVAMIEKAESGDYDAILMDIQMPLMNGRDATRAIRALKKPIAQDIKIIAMTADAFAEDIEACFDAGMNGHIPKPVDLKNLLKELRRCMGGGLDGHKVKNI